MSPTPSSASAHRLIVALCVLATVFAIGGPDVVRAGASDERETGPGDTVGSPRIPEPAPTQVSKPVLYARDHYTWPYDTGPLHAERTPDVRRPGVFHSRVGSFDLTLGSPEFPAALRAAGRPDAGAHRYFVLMLDPNWAASGGLDYLRVDLESAGGSAAVNLAGPGMIARLSAESYESVSETSGVIALEPYHPAFKLSPWIGRAPLPDQAAALSEVYDLELLLFPGEAAQPVAAAATALGANVLTVRPDLVRVEIHRDHLAALAALEPVRAIFEHAPLFLFGQEETTTVQTGMFAAGATPYHDAGVDGGGGGVAAPQVLMLLDNGIQLDAGDLSDARLVAGAASPAHRKVLSYTTTFPFGGAGDNLGCDASAQGSFTHGHTVAAVALGNATDVEPAYGGGWGKLGNRALDGVAPGGLLAMYDAEITSPVGPCSNPLLDTLTPGDLYSGPFGGSLGEAYSVHGALTFNFSWGSVGIDAYTSNSDDVDRFLFDHDDAMLFLAAGNSGPAAGSVSSPATAKNSVVVGASFTNNPSPNQENRWPGSSVGPVVGGRIAPILMAPGADTPDLDAESAISCRTSDNDQGDAVECALTEAHAGTSWASAAAAGSAMLVRDYLAQGFYPDGSPQNPGIANVSGALVKAMLVASADWMNDPVSPNLPGGNLSTDYRFNDEQGYGRITLSNVLPLNEWTSWTPSVLLVHDGGTGGGQLDLPLPPDINAFVPDVQQATFDVCNDMQELRVALAWVEDPGATLINDLHLELEAPNGTVYFGNYFTDDNNRDGILDPGEDCPSIGTLAPGTRDAGPWSLPSCFNSPRDGANPTEAIFLSPDADGNGDFQAPFNQIETGQWTVRVRSAGGGNTFQGYAVAIAGGLCQPAIVLSQEKLCCNDKFTIKVVETDPTASISLISANTTVQVIDPLTSMVMDEETGLAFGQPTPGQLLFTAGPFAVTQEAPAVFNDGLIQIEHGKIVKATYQNPSTGTMIMASATVDCMADLGFGGVLFEQFGRNTAFRVEGGCERDARGGFSNGFPDAYLDAGEIVSYHLAFRNDDAVDLQALNVELTAVEVDGDSPKDCAPGSTACPDPDRDNNPTCSQHVQILDSPKTVPLLPAGAPGEIAFTLKMADFIPGTPKCELVARLTSATSGKTEATVLVSRHKLNIDDQAFYYSTDFPTGGVEFRDYNNDELIEDPTTDPLDPDLDYRFETTFWSDLTTGLDAAGSSVAVNSAVSSPWNFDGTSGGFVSGLGAISDDAAIADLIALWGEDQNFNGIEDGVCQNDPSIACYAFPNDPRCPGNTCISVENNNADGTFTQNRNTRGGCGWQTRAPGTCSGDPQRGCFFPDDCAGTCQVPFNQVVSTFAPCGALFGSCGTTMQCANSAPNPSAPCSSSVDCGGDACLTVGQACVGDGGDCTGPEGLFGGVWHTGGIGSPPQASCLVSGGVPGECQAYETITGSGGQRRWFELLLTPVLEKVNQSLDPDGEPVARVELVDFAWNASLDLADAYASFTWEFDNDVDSATPVDLIADDQVLGFVSGPLGAVTGGPFLPTGGYPMFATLDPSGAVSVNGTLGNNRIGDNSCFFEAGSVPPVNRGLFSLAAPPDDDLDQDFDGPVDEFVESYGPIRNMNISLAGGPDLRYELVEDFIGDGGNRFQGAFGFLLTEADAFSTPSAGFGASIDDPVIQWREIECVEDTVDCSINGSCATISVDSSAIYDSHALVSITVIDSSPYGPFGVNDCDDDGAFVGPADDTDCDDDAVPDVLVRVVSDAEPEGEILVLNQDPSSTLVYRATIPISTKHDVDGTVFVQMDGTNEAAIGALYEDLDDGTGSPCPNSLQPSLEGHVRATATVSVPAGRVIVEGYRLQDNGDGDLYADTNEQVDMYVTVGNKSGMQLTNLTAHLFVDDSKIECVSVGTIFIGNLLDGESVESPTPFVFTVADVQRAFVYDDFSVDFRIALSADQVWTADRPQTITLDLDLDVQDGFTPAVFFEGFEAGLGQFSPMPLDNGLNDNVLSDGYRCQLNDPDFPLGNSPGDPFCYLGFANPANNGFDWHNHDPGSPDGGRAVEGVRSLHFGVHTGLGETTRLSQLDAVVTTDPINLGWNGTSPELSFAHQISLADFRTFPVPQGESLDRGVVQVQEIDLAGFPVGPWETLDPFFNLYDVQGTASTSQCMFDPVDDDSVEDDRDSLSDPFNPLGPSSTCYSRFVFGNQGDTSHDGFDPFKIGRASDGPAIQGFGAGTWVEPRFNLQRYRGKRIRIRFLASTAKFGDQVTYLDLGLPEESTAEDGWYVDAVTVSDTLQVPATLLVDITANPLVGCGPVCTTVVAVLDVNKQLPAVSGQQVPLSAAVSAADSCHDGVLQYEFWIDGDGNGMLGDAADQIIRPFNDDPTHTVAPTQSTTYGVRVRCSSDPTCSDEDFATVLILNSIFSTKQVTNNTCDPVRTLIYRIDYVNDTQQVAERVQIFDTLDPRFEPVSAGDVTRVPNGLVYYNPADTLNVWVNEDFAPGEGGFVEFPVTYAAGVAPFEPIPNSARVVFGTGSATLSDTETNTVLPVDPVEVCNGVDDDCNGLVDEGVAGAGDFCPTGELGVCEAGINVCDGGAFSCLRVQGPTCDICGNGLDDDCDGIADEDDAADLDGDGVRDCVDNCCDVPNPMQEDDDSDGMGDVCDCTPPPAEVGNTVMVRKGPVYDCDVDSGTPDERCTEISWGAVPGVNEYHVYRGYRTTGRDFVLNQQCLFSNDPGLIVTEPFKPRVFTMFYYLVSTKCPVGAAVSTLGFGRDVAGAPTARDQPFFCPDPTMNSDGDSVVDALDNCPALVNDGQTNSDNDNHGDVCDNCDFIDNPDQADQDGDGEGNLCDLDLDGDGVPQDGGPVTCSPPVITNCDDNCPNAANPGQEDEDGDLIGDACDDTDGDGILDDGDGSGTAGDNRCVGGATVDCDDNCPLTPNPGQEDGDLDGIGDVCE